MRIIGANERKEQEKIIKRNDIIEAAERVFFTKGYDIATMDDVAKEAEFSKKTVYVYFNSKSQIYFEIMIRGYKLLNGMLEEEFKSKKPNNAIDKLKQIGEVLYKFSNQYECYFKSIMEYENGEMDFENGIQDESKEECYLQGEKIFKILEDTLAEGVNEGMFIKTIDMKSTAIVLWASAIGIFNILKKKVNYIKNYHNRNEEQIINEALNILIRSIKS